MGDILWGERPVGARVSVGEDETGAYVVMGEPDWIRVPPELGGEAFRVARVYQKECPCGESHAARTLDLAGTDLCVSECVFRGFLWWRESKESLGGK